MDVRPAPRVRPFRLLVKGANDARSRELAISADPQAAVVPVPVEAGATYRLVNPDTDRQPDGLSLRQVGTTLVVEVEGQPALELQGFYPPDRTLGAATAAAPATSLGGTSLRATDLAIYQLDDACASQPQITAETPPVRSFGANESLIWSSDTEAICLVPLTTTPLPDLPLLAGIGAVALAVPGGGGGGAAAALGNLVVHGSIHAGAVIGGATVYAYGQDGSLLGSAAIRADGSYSIMASGLGGYRGTVLLRVADTNAQAVNYLDEVTATQRSLGTDLRAMGVAQVGDSHFAVSALDADLAINITPLTELATRQAQVAGTVPPATAAAIATAQGNVASAMGIAGVDLTGSVVVTNTAAFNGADGLSDGERYGLALAKLSGLDSRNGGSVGLSLMQLQQTLTGNTFDATGTALIDQGRQQALDALKASTPDDSGQRRAAGCHLYAEHQGDRPGGQFDDRQRHALHGGHDRTGAADRASHPRCDQRHRYQYRGQRDRQRDPATERNGRAGGGHRTDGQRQDLHDHSRSDDGHLGGDDSASRCAA